MRIDFELPGFEGRELYVDYSVVTGARVMLDGRPAPHGPDRGVYLLKRNDGSIAPARFQGFFLDPATRLEVDGRTITLLPPLKWHEWVWAGLPLILLLGGAFGSVLAGVLGGAIAPIVLYLNGRVFRSELPVGARYVVSGIFTAGAVMLWLFVGMLLYMAIPPIGPSKIAATDQMVPTPAKEEQRIVETTMLGPGRAIVHVDNDSSEALELQIDGETWGKLEPYAIEGIELKKGVHEFRFLRGQQQEVDRIETDLREGKVTVINPGGRGEYRVVAFTYSTGGPFTGQAPSVSDVGGQKAVETDYGLLNPLPDSIRVVTGPAAAPQGARVQTEKRTKLTKKIAGKGIGVERAIAMIESPAAYDPADLSEAFESLGQSPPRDDVRALLLECVESSNDLLINGALSALKPYADGISEERLLKWLKGDRRRLVAAATRVMMHRNDGADLRAQFPKLSQRSQEIVVRATYENLPHQDKPSPALRKFLLKSAFKSWPEDAAAALYHQITDEDLALDDELVKHVDAFVAGLKTETNKRLWNSVWGRRLCRSSLKMDNPWIMPRLLAIIEDPKPLVQYDIKSDAIQALVLRNEADRLVPVLPKLETQQRVLAASRVADSCRAKKSLSDAEAAFIQAVLAGERDPAARAAMVQAVLPALSPVIAGSDEAAAMKAIGTLGTVYDPAAITNLRTLFEASSSPARKARILEITGVTNDAALTQISPLYAKGLADPGPAVRAAAFEAVRKWGSTKERKSAWLGAVQAAAAKETDPELKRKMTEWLK